jgi:hypothetical protein
MHSFGKLKTCISVVIPKSSARSDWVTRHLAADVLYASEALVKHACHVVSGQIKTPCRVASRYSISCIEA